MGRLFGYVHQVSLLALKESFAYKSYLLISLLTGPLFFLIQYFIWSSILGDHGTMNGLDLDQLLVYFSIVTLLQYILNDNAMENLQQQIYSGNFLSFLLKPVSYISYAFAQKIGQRAVGFLMEFVPVYLLITLLFRLRVVPEYPFWFVLSLALSFLLVFIINFCIGICSFWLTRILGLRMSFIVVRDLSAGIFIPLQMFPDWAQKLLFFLPFQYITYVPIRVFLGSYELGGYSFTIPQIVGIQAAVVAVMAGVLWLSWNRGLRKFTGVGA